jgi:hypothetical protein
MTYVEMFTILSKPWASVKDIKSIASCGRDEATNIRNIISKEILDTGKNLPTSKEKIVPMEYVIKYHRGID